jgi:hypothetical protein
MIKNVLSTLVLGTATLGLVAQENETSPLYVGLTAGFSQADLRAYQGGKSNGYSVELGYDFTKPDNFVGIRLYTRYSRWTGDYSERLDITQDLISYGTGLEFSFHTPIRGLRPYVGAGMTWWDGKRVSDSSYLGYLQAVNIYREDPDSDFAKNNIILAGPHPEGQGKLGVRFGVNYLITKQFAVSLDYNFFQWLNINPETAPEDIVVSNYPIKGYNRVNPSWLGLTLKYHFDIKL